MRLNPAPGLKLLNDAELESTSFSFIASAANRELVGLPPSYFLENGSTKTTIVQTGNFSQAGNSNSQKIKVTKAPAPEIGQQLDTCQRDNESLKSQLVLANTLVAAKDSTITLLRASIKRPTP